MNKLLGLTLLMLFSSGLCAQVEEEEYEPLSKPSNPDVYAQDEDNGESSEAFDTKTITERLLYGGNFQLQFGTVTVVETSPRVGYRVTKDFTAGLGINYIYINYNSAIAPPNGFSTSIYGGNTFGTYHFTDFLPLAIHTEFELLRAPSIADINERVSVPNFYVGPGFVQRTARGGGVYLFLLYNLLWQDDPNSIISTTSPFTLRASFLF